MKKLIVLLTALCSISGIFAATLNIENKTSQPIHAGIIFGGENKMAMINPGKWDKFNSWLKGIDMVRWTEGSQTYQAPANISALQTEGMLTIYSGGRYDLKPCLACGKQSGLQAQNMNPRVAAPAPATPVAPAPSYAPAVPVAPAPTYAPAVPVAPVPTYAPAKPAEETKLTPRQQEALGKATEALKQLKAAQEAEKEGERLNMLGKQAMNSKNYAQAKEYFEQAIKLKNIDAHYGLAAMYQDGLGVTKDQKKADELFHQADDITLHRGQAAYEASTSHF